MRHVAVAFLLVTMAGTTVRADEVLAYAAVYPDSGGGACEHTGGSPAATAHVVVTNSIPMKQITFSAPIPNCLAGSVIFETSPFATTGDSQTGITIDLGGCTESPVTVLTIYFFGTLQGPYGCCYWPVLAADGSEYSRFEFVDCNDVTRTGLSSAWLTIASCCEEFDVLSPYEPYPPDGTTGVPTDVTLSWLLPDLRCEEWIYWTTIPYPPTGPRPGTTDYFTAYQPESPFEPNTTYYWTVGLQCSYDTGATGDLWSFTTGDAVAVERSTWGQIKALYRR